MLWMLLMNEIIYRDSIIGGGRVITVYLNGIQIAGAVEHSRSRLSTTYDLATFWHVTTTAPFPARTTSKTGDRWRHATRLPPAIGWRCSSG